MFGESRSGVELFQLSLQNLADEIRICFALAGLHHLPFEKIECGGFARFKIGGALRISGDDLVTELFDGPGVAHLREAFLLDDRRRWLAVLKHLTENVLSDF